MQCCSVNEILLPVSIVQSTPDKIPSESPHQPTATSEQTLCNVVGVFVSRSVMCQQRFHCRYEPEEWDEEVVSCSDMRSLNLEVDQNKRD